jgi:Uma2 family endonuclease
MSIVSASRRAVSGASVSERVPGAIQGDQRIVLRGLSWNLYDQLSEAIDEQQHVYLAFDGKDLELMTTGPLHENFKEFLGAFIREVGLGIGVNFRGLGQTTWKRESVGRGLEADHCYYFDTAKLEAEAQSRARQSNDVADYPNPDLAVAIDISPSQIDRPGIYASLRIAEVWRCEGRSLLIEQLGSDGTYHASESSQFLWVRPEEVVRWLIDDDSSDQAAWTRRLREWIEHDLAPRIGG